MLHPSSRALIHATAGLTMLWLAACGDDSASAGTEGATAATTTDDGPPPVTCRTATLPGARQHCQEDDGTTSTTSPPAEMSSDDGMETTGSSPDLPDEPPPLPDEFDCNDVPEAFLAFQLIDGPRGYHGLAISPEGLAIGSDGSSLLASTRYGMVSVFVPGIGAGHQMDWLTDGDLAYATDDSAITRIRANGTIEVIRAGVGAYGVTLGPDGLLYIAPNFGPNDISRIDPDTGDMQFLFSGNADTMHSLGFSPDGQRLYIGTIGSSTVYYVDLDADMNPTTELLILATEVGEGWHDAVAVDICGYLYVPDFWSRNLYRISPTGEVIIFWSPANSDHYAHGLVWGTGEHGWREDALYFPQPYNGNTVGEVVVGVPPRDWDGTVLNVPEPL